MMILASVGESRVRISNKVTACQTQIIDNSILHVDLKGVIYTIKSHKNLFGALNWKFVLQEEYFFGFEPPYVTLSQIIDKDNPNILSWEVIVILCFGSVNHTDFY